VKRVGKGNPSIVGAVSAGLLVPVAYINRFGLKLGHFFEKSGNRTAALRINTMKAI
jgi:hypothetical protein